MTKNIGLSRNIKIDWLNETANYLQSEKDEKRLKEHLSQYLSYEIKSEINNRKTCKILMNIWFCKDIEANKIHQQALYFIKLYPEYSMAIHWSMIIKAYPVFADICKIIGQIAKFQDIFTNNQLKQKMFDEWGERSTLFYSIEKTLATLKEFGVIKNIKQGSYEICKQNVTNDEILLFMLKCFLLSDNKESRTLEELQNLACFFPFNYNITSNLILNSTEFKVFNLGGSLNISAT